MSESFSVILSTTSSNAQTSGLANYSNVNFYVNWDAILPRKYKQFIVSMVFKSDAVGTLATSVGNISVNLGKINVSNGISPITNLGFCVPTVLGSTNSFYQSTSNDVIPVSCQYPMNNIVTVSILTNAGGNLFSGTTSWSLYLNFVGIDGLDLERINVKDTQHLSLPKSGFL